MNICCTLLLAFLVTLHRIQAATGRASFAMAGVLKCHSSSNYWYRVGTGIRKHPQTSDTSGLNDYCANNARHRKPFSQLGRQRARCQPLGHRRTVDRRRLWKQPHRAPGHTVSVPVVANKTVGNVAAEYQWWRRCNLRRCCRCDLPYWPANCIHD